MKLRWKFLGFLTLFLCGSFLIVTWKSYDIFAKKYIQNFQQLELQDLEKTSSLVSTQFDSLRSLLQHAPSEMNAQLKARNISLLAHVLKDEGKWKAQWFEGQAGLRGLAQGVAQQIPFESLSTSKKSWHQVKLKDQMLYNAYVIPSYSNSKLHFYAFFFRKEFLTKILKGSTAAENITLISPRLGEIYSQSERTSESLDKWKDVSQKHSRGILPLDKSTAMAYYFNPDLQLYFIKDFNTKKFRIESASYLVGLFAIILLLIGLSLLALDLLLKNIFSRISSMTAEIRPFNSSVSLSQETFADELTELELLLAKMTKNQIPSVEENISVTKPTVEPQNKTTDAFGKTIEQIRPKTINALGYLNRLKTHGGAESLSLQLLEKELRELRNLIDPQVPVSIQPNFNPLMDFVSTTSLKEESEVQTEILIRRPKREGHESR